ncbi:tripartite tricarboxylate transporter substrate binding protein [Xylophilus rhododendri]|uniref:Tripartite tricarboxylate transporter substrate binding protein n=1 Tax=Xylophilus rhododendri TaxID=2697032 RepID=A0A857J0H4_9BURK|nr:tripartite tricarboxylate transporter substrate binding protein [Xylophilus rhododendri]QHI96602.1 tripartite tricarboxylate transporter substrate binding protein [Xylophilus rhododendri]
MKTNFARPLVLALTLLAGAAQAQTAAFPNKPIHINVGASAGGGTDVVARLIGEKMGPLIGQPFIIDNRPGAANTIAADVTAKAPADGYSLLAATNSPQVIAPHLMKLSFDPLKQLTPLGMVVQVPHVLIVNAASSFRSFPELLAEIKAKPDNVRYASSGIGSVQHIAAELFMASTGSKMIHIPYKGSSQAHQDILAGQVEMMLDTTSSAMGLIKAGKFRALAVTTPKRAAELPDVPTLDELGVKGAEMSTWYAMYAPAATPAPVLDRLVRDFQKTLQMPEVQSKLKGLGGEPSTLTREQFIALQASDDKRFAALIKQRDIKLD